jgi:hypothetical protein
MQTLGFIDDTILSKMALGRYVGKIIQNRFLKN